MKFFVKYFQIGKGTLINTSPLRELLFNLDMKPPEACGLTVQCTSVDPKVVHDDNSHCSADSTESIISRMEVTLKSDSCHASPEFELSKWGLSLVPDDARAVLRKLNQRKIDASHC